MPMAPTMTLTTALATKPLHRADRDLLRYGYLRREALRRGVIAAVALTLATLVVGLSFLVGTHLVAAWWIQSLHGAVLWDIDQTNWRQGGVTSVSLVSTNPWNPNIGDADLTHLRRLHRVVSLNLAENDRITNKGLAGLRGLDFLTELNLERLDRYRQPPTRLVSIPLTDACLLHLQALPRLENLTLAGNLITDKGLAQIARMASLKVLDLSATEVSDVGLVHLERMKNLERVDLAATRVTKEGIAQLRLARPDLSIELDTEPSVEQGVTMIRGLDR
jgi:hypothetical protein